MRRRLTVLSLLLSMSLSAACETGGGETIVTATGKTVPATELNTLEDELRTAVESETLPPDFDQKLARYIELDPPPDKRVWALAQQINRYRIQGDLEKIPAKLEELEAAIEKLEANVMIEHEKKWAMQNTEYALRLVHIEAFDRWSSSFREDAALLLKQNSKLYQELFPDAIETGEVLWRDAEFQRLSGNHMGAIPYYERVIEKDFLNKYDEMARQRIIDAWTDASMAAELPTDVQESQPLPSPHREWVAIVMEDIDADRLAEKSRKNLFRITKLQFAYHQWDEAETLLLELAHSKKDDIAVKAAVRILKFAMDHPERYRKYDFRKLRHNLQENDYLWSRGDFRSQYFRMKDIVEAR